MVELGFEIDSDCGFKNFVTSPIPTSLLAKTFVRKSNPQILKLLATEQDINTSRI